ncbi:DUF397 domain-containing protein [Streptomyces turgidiscabies]|uniref:Putative toxin-antitoxin system, toxin component n=1 Tax=Streptomyces turgidiscabies (strain Car8) TaxID=698760 RepID=L7F9P5_STRT8|nr:MULTISPECIES: DUF397 domain-containing protein [Streptomyces]ELP67839.1 putative toxin-antitoxin system, toxin component [Streptomyces turgidiscabies Car8]MDX3493162.1 DUF397 domain-containing protein [Streptomyces turgidiscabies]GAQ70459.1 hypothetical protein T45_02194 [Streptomyces turgidiscabies]
MASIQPDLSTAVWRKSSYSNGTGGECVELAGAFPEAALWRKSSYSNGTGGDCVEVSATPGVIPVRDSKTAAHNGPVLLFQAGAWAAFLTDVKG